MSRTLEIVEVGGLSFLARPGTNDYNTVHACIADDEYGLADVNVKGMLVADVGAHIGSVGIWLASRGARVVFVEPVPDNVDLIRRNAKMNGVPLVTVLMQAAGTPGWHVVRWGFEPDPTWNERVTADPSLGLLHTDQVRESIRHHAPVGTTCEHAPVDQLFSEARVRGITLHDFIQDYGIPDLVKLDCEGGEWAWLEDPAMTCVDIIVGEWHPWVPQDPQGAGVLRGFGGCPGTMGRNTIVELLGVTHDVVFSGLEAGPGGFRATLKRDKG